MKAIVFALFFGVVLQGCTTLKPDGRGLVNSSVSKKLNASTVLLSGDRTIIYLEEVDDGINLDSIDVSDGGELIWSRKTRDNVWFVSLVDVDKHLSALRKASEWSVLAAAEAEKVRARAGNAFTYNIEKDIGTAGSGLYGTTYRFVVTSGVPQVYIRTGNGLISLRQDEIDRAVKEIQLFKVDRLTYREDPRSLKDNSIYK